MIGSRFAQGQLFTGPAFWSACSSRWRDCLTHPEKIPSAGTDPVLGEEVFFRGLIGDHPLEMSSEKWLCDIRETGSGIVCLRRPRGCFDKRSSRPRLFV